MCTSNLTNPNNNNNNNMSGGRAQGQGNIYPDLSQMFQGNQGTQQAQAQPIMQLLEALGLVPPGAAHVPSAPPAAASTDSTSPPTAPTDSASAPTAPTGSSNGSGQANYGAQANPGCESCQHCNPQRARPSASCWSAWTAAPNATYQQPSLCSNFDFPRFFTNLGKILKNVIQCTTRVSSLVFMLVFIHLLTPVALLQNIVFMVLAAGLGLHMPTLLAGQLLWAGVGCLRMFEPFFLAGLLIFTVHKIFVRKEPLIDQQFWRNRFANFNANCGQN